MKFKLDFYRNKRIFITGHTGFKGSWLCKILSMAGADITGYALKPPTDPNLFKLSGIGEDINSIIGDIRNFDRLYAAFSAERPEIVFHLAAQPIVRESYDKPHLTFETNVMGTVNILECVRRADCVKSLINVTTDKVYEEHAGARREGDTLGGYDPYSGSKSCSELVTRSYRQSFFTNGRTAISTVRAGNVIGGGDFAKDRIIPDCVRAATRGENVTVRNPHSQRAFQHVLEPLFAYLMIAERQYNDISYSGSYNVGGCGIETGELAQKFCTALGGISWVSAAPKNAPRETETLTLDCSKLKNAFGWEPVWGIDEAVEKTVEWTRAYLDGGDFNAVMQKQIYEYIHKIHLI